jgi:hypothetical protein
MNGPSLQPIAPVDKRNAPDSVRGATPRMPLAEEIGPEDELIVSLLPLRWSPTAAKPARELGIKWRRARSSPLLAPIPKQHLLLPVRLPKAASDTFRNAVVAAVQRLVDLKTVTLEPLATEFNVDPHRLRMVLLRCRYSETRTPLFRLIRHSLGLAPTLVHLGAGVHDNIRNEPATE